MCAGVQKVSRPIVRCQEMSQRMPIAMQVPPAMTALAPPETLGAGKARAGATTGAVRISVSIATCCQLKRDGPRVERSIGRAAHVNGIGINPRTQLAIQLQPSLDPIDAGDGNFILQPIRVGFLQHGTISQQTNVTGCWKDRVESLTFGKVDFLTH